MVIVVSDTLMIMPRTPSIKLISESRAQASYPIL